MSSKSKMDIFNFIYILGMVVVIVGFCMPVFSSSFLGKHSANGFTILQHISAKKVALRICDIAVFGGAVAGVIFGFISDSALGRFLTSLLKLIALTVTIGCGVYFFNNYFSGFSKNFIDVGFYMIIAGWFIALIGGWFTSK